VAGMLAAREPEPGSRFEGLSAGRGWRAVDEDGEPGLKVRRSGGCGQVPQPGQDLGQEAVAGREPQGQVAGQPAGDGDQPPAQGGDHGLAAAHAVPVQDVLAGGGGGELVQPGGHGRGEQRAPHPGQVHLGVSRREVPEGGAELAVAEDVLKGQARLHT